jgi:hypothetical protein
MDFIYIHTCISIYEKDWSVNKIKYLILPLGDKIRNDFSII